MAYANETESTPTILRGVWVKVKRRDTSAMIWSDMNSQIYNGRSADTIAEGESLLIFCRDLAICGHGRVNVPTLATATREEEDLNLPFLLV